jgi:hypothetical protein
MQNSIYNFIFILRKLFKENLVVHLFRADPSFLENLKVQKVQADQSFLSLQEVLIDRAVLVSLISKYILFYLKLKIILLEILAIKEFFLLIK